MSLTGKAKQNMLLKGSINRLKVIYTDAYELAVKNGFEGTLDEWLAAIKGEPGDTPYIKDGTWWIGEENTGVAATEPGPQGEQGIQGEPGPAGDDYTLTEADKQEIAELAAGMVDVPEGGSGADGFSPIATVTPTDDGAVISITDKSGTTTATINHGTDGQPGKDGADGTSASLSIKYASSAWDSQEPTEWQASIPTLTPTEKYLWAKFTKTQGLSMSVWSGVVGVYGDTGPAGPQGDPGDAYVLTEADKQTIAALAAGLVEVPSGGSAGKETVYEFTTTEVCTEIADTLSAEVTEKIWNASIISIYVYMAKDTTDTTTNTEGKLTLKFGGNMVCEQTSVIPCPTTSWINHCELECIILNMLTAGNAVPAIVEYRKHNQSPSQPAFKQSWMFKPGANGYGVNIIGSQNFGIGTKVKIAIA